MLAYAFRGKLFAQDVGLYPPRRLTRRCKGVESVALFCDSFSSLVSVCILVFFQSCDAFPWGMLWILS